MTRFPETERARLLALLERVRSFALVVGPDSCESCGCLIEHGMEHGLPVSHCTGCESISNLPEEDWREER